MKKLIVGISAADGVRIGQRLLELLWKMPEVETHLVISRAAERNFQLEWRRERRGCQGRWRITAMSRRICQRPSPADPLSRRA